MKKYFYGADERIIVQRNKGEINISSDMND